jgi:hypothetical protein
VVDWLRLHRRREFLREMGLAEDYRGDIYSFLEPSTEPSAEEAAVEASMRGDQSKLADLIENWLTSQHPGSLPEGLEAGTGLGIDPEVEYIPPSEPSPAAWKLVLEFLREERSLSTGRKKGEQQLRGRPPMGNDARTEQTPTHDAATYEVPAVGRLLRIEYPGYSETDYRDRALYVVARWCRMRRQHITVKKLWNYLNRSPRDRRRLQR